MEITPVINCADFDCVKIRLRIAEEILCSDQLVSVGGWVHLDIADGSFTNGYSTWRNSSDLKKIRLSERIRLGVHIMSSEPEFLVREWLEAGADRIIIHIEPSVAVDAVVNMCEAHNAECWLAVTPDTPAEKLFPYLELVKGCQVLAVHPGLPRQQLEPGTIEKIQAIRAAFPNLPIEVDGGVTLETAPKLSAAGATQLAAGSIIFEADNPVSIYHQLREVV